MSSLTGSLNSYRQPSQQGRNAHRYRATRITREVDHHRTPNESRRVRPRAGGSGHVAMEKRASPALAVSIVSCPGRHFDATP